MLKHNTIDTHIHLFNYDGPIKQKFSFNNYIGFLDIEFDKDGNDIKAYDDFISNYYDEEKHILLATAKTVEDIEFIFNKHKSIIKGFGELKLYDKYLGEKMPYKKISILRSVCDLSSKNGNLPVYVHWELVTSRDVELFENVLKKYSNIPIVLCHCGMNGDNNLFAHSQCIRLQHIYSNLWVDVSYKAADHYYESPMKLFNLSTDRILIGSDLNCKIFGPSHTDDERLEIYKKVRVIRSYIASDRNACRLFNIKETLN